MAKKKRQFKKNKVNLKIVEIIRTRGFTHRATSYICTYKKNTIYSDLVKFYSKLLLQYIELLNREFLSQKMKNLNSVGAIGEGVLV